MTLPTDRMTITQDTTFEAGVYCLPGGIEIVVDGITLDGNGALLMGVNQEGVGLRLNGRRGITIKNLGLSGYYHGLRAQDCQGLTIVGCRIQATGEVPANTSFLDVWLPVEKSYGGGILLHNVQGSTLMGCDLQHQMNGLLTYGCQRLTVKGNNASYCSGWGFHLYETCDSLFEDNYADYCCRYQPRGPRQGHMGADAAGFLIVHRSCRNTFRGNLARLGGDGFFLGGMTPQFEPVGCDENLFEANDGSYSPNIAFEATFSRGNVYRDNLANFCNYGFWLGFSRGGFLENNQVNANRQAGVAVENGFGFVVRGNRFELNTHGILLWSKRVPAFEKGVPENYTSYDWQIEDNLFAENRKAVRIAADQDHGISPLDDSGQWGLPAPKPYDHRITRNQMVSNRVAIEVEQAHQTHIAENDYHGEGNERNIREVSDES